MSTSPLYDLMLASMTGLAFTYVALAVILFMQVFLFVVVALIMEVIVELIFVCPLVIPSVFPHRHISETTPLISRRGRPVHEHRECAPTVEEYLAINVVEVNLATLGDGARIRSLPTRLVQLPERRITNRNPELEMGF
ncbi:hypothetical protein K458DRAFT_383839 [Lentithecium fluviatile CBS 122367]|uniref:Uncharacterized protein n=1 Tax=Lentithecium fluviatile CBS 122367 TaxID=1168545 RepID=A0A6G1JG18_9PLEO|nr:hypothetical protein K458DRAFT_383839 [Lentithecium fluviatile CBS 122367]